MSQQRMQLIRNATLAAALTVVVAACGSSAAEAEDPSSNSEGAQTEFTIELSEFAFSPDNITLPAGQTVTLTLKNSGTIEHEFMLGRAVMEDGGYMEDLLIQLDPEVVSGHGYAVEGLDEAEEGHEAEEGEMHHGAEIEVEPGGEVTLTLNIPADAIGTWEIGCFVPGHSDAGMHGTVTISG